MDPLEFMENEKLLLFLRRNKTEISCMENPHTFLSRLRDYSLIPEDKYQSIIRMKSKEKLKKNVYEVLDWVETERSEHMKVFWRCVFSDTIMNQYPKLRLLHKSVMDGLFQFGIQMPETLGNEERGEPGVTSVEKKRKERDESVCEDGEQPGPSFPVTPAQKRKSAKKSSSDNVVEIEESDEDDQASANTTQSSPGSTDEEEESGEQNGQQSQRSRDSNQMVIKVTCGSLEGTLHKRRFASGTRGKSVRTDTSWLTPVEFTKKALGQIDASWRKDIKCNGKPLSALIESEALNIHKEMCHCALCQPSIKDLENQRNDNECCLCKSDNESLVKCDGCPRSFHQKCHLPHVKGALSGRSNSQWMCTFCVFRINQEYYHRDELTREAAMAHDMSQHMLECQYVFMLLCCANEKQAFTLNPCLDLQDYSNVIETPMWLGSIADKLQRRLYKTVGEFVSDVQLIFTNCAVYNRETAGIQVEAKRLKKIFDKDFKDVFNISS